MRELDGYRAAFDRLPGEIKEAEAEGEKTVCVEAVVKDGISTGMSYSEKTELYIRATGEKTGMLYTEKLSMDPMEAIMQAYQNSLDGEAAEPMNGTPCKIRKSLGECKELEASYLHTFSKALEENLRAGYEQAGSIQVRTVQKISTLGLVNSKGADVCGTSSRFDVTVTAAHRENAMIAYTETVTAQKLSDIGSEYFLESLRNWEKTIRPQQAGFTPQTYRAVLSSQVVNFILVTAWQLFSAKYCQEGSSPLAQRLGEKLFSECITIGDYKDKGYPFLLDSEGTLSQDVLLAEKGVLKGFLHNLSTGAEAGVGSTGNGGRKALLSGNIHTDMTIVPKNFVIEAGKDSLEELLAKCGNGIYIYESYDQFHGLNRITGDFNFPCKGIMVEDGKLTGCVSGLSMNGNVLELLADVEALGREQKIEPMAMYENYLVSGPAMLVGHLRISG